MEPRYLVVAIPNKRGIARSELKALGQAFRGARGLCFRDFGGRPGSPGLLPTGCQGVGEPSRKHTRDFQKRASGDKLYTSGC